MSKLGCTCGHYIRDQSDFLPYKARIREDEDTQKPIELLAETLAQWWEARQHGQEAEFIRQFELTQGEGERAAEWDAQELAGKPLATVLFHLIYPFWTNYDRTIFECEACGRLWVERDDGTFAPYLPESDTRHVLWSRNNHEPYGPHRE
jgi:hypothetical protein